MTNTNPIERAKTTQEVLPMLYSIRKNSSAFDFDQHRVHAARFEYRISWI